MKETEIVFLVMLKKKSTPEAEETNKCTFFSCRGPVIGSHFLRQVAHKYLQLQIQGTYGLF